VKKKHAGKNHISLYGNRGSELHDNKKQEDPSGTNGNDEVLSPAAQAYTAQGNEIKG
jgi:hypothetical protein